MLLNNLDPDQERKRMRHYARRIQYFECLNGFDPRWKDEALQELRLLKIAEERYKLAQAYLGQEFIPTEACAHLNELNSSNHEGGPRE